MGAITFVTGGARSGKSRHAEALATASGAPVVYLATMEPRDEELIRRIALHCARRPINWTTLEEPLDIQRALTSADSGATVLLDCLSLWTSNLLFAMVPDPDASTPADWERMIEHVVGAASSMLLTQRGRRGALIAVSNEIGSGIVPGDALSRAYRDGLGLVNQALAAAADDAWLLVSGLAIRLK